MYNEVRLLMMLLLMALITVALRSILRKFAEKYKIRNWHKLFCIAVIILILGFSIAIDWPFENLFVRFDSPEAAFNI